MADRTSIEWTDRTSGVLDNLQDRSVGSDQRHHERQPIECQSIDPGERVGRALPAVARRASGNHVADLSNPATGYWDHMVEMFCRSAATIGAQSRRSLEQHRSRAGANCRNAPFSSSGAAAIWDRIARVPSPPISIAMFSTLSSTHVVKWAPCLATGTPRSANTAPARPSLLARSRHRPWRRGSTARRQTVASAAVGVERVAPVPYSARTTPLLASLQSLNVLTFGNSNALRGYADGTSPTAHGVIITGGTDTQESQNG